tara:strand:+ start:1003 stop:1614 length:612 start_codon:yes stop_codon:yes gene_type:complete
MSLTSHVHKFYVLTREPSPVGNASTVVTTRRKISKGEIKSGTSPLKKYDSKTDKVKEEQVESNKIQLNPGESKEETLQGATLRWTMTHTGVEHTVAEVITFKELQMLRSFSTGLAAYSSIAEIVRYRKDDTIGSFDDDLNPVLADIEVGSFLSMIQKTGTTQLSHLFDVVFERNLSTNWEGELITKNVHDFALANLPPNVTIG